MLEVHLEGINERFASIQVLPVIVIYNIKVPRWDGTSVSGAAPVDLGPVLLQIVILTEWCLAPDFALR